VLILKTEWTTSQLQDETPYSWGDVFAIFGYSSLAESNREDHPRTVQAIKSSFYVDDCLTGADTVEEAMSL